MIDPNCPRCHGEGWIEDETACGDPEHCAPFFRCHVCNPNGDYE